MNNNSYLLHEEKRTRESGQRPTLHAGIRIAVILIFFAISPCELKATSNVPSPPSRKDTNNQQPAARSEYFDVPVGNGLYLMLVFSMIYATIGVKGKPPLPLNYGSDEQ